MGMNTIKTIKSGPLEEKICYSQAMPYDPPAVRKAKGQETTEAQKRLNNKRSGQSLERSLATNFAASDWFLTLTFNDEHLPADRAGAQKEYARYVRRIKPEFKRLGVELKYIYCIESVPEGPGMPRRLHVHAVINGGERALAVILSKWRAGRAHAEPLLDGPMDDYAPRALYMVKERAPDAAGWKKSQRAWIPSKNLDKPIVTSELVPDTRTIAAPLGAHILDSGEHYNGHGGYKYLKYLLPADRRPGPDRRKMNTVSNIFLEAHNRNNSTYQQEGKHERERKRAGSNPAGRTNDRRKSKSKLRTG